jgi:hypothetical protein
MGLLRAWIAARDEDVIAVVAHWVRRCSLTLSNPS